MIDLGELKLHRLLGSRPAGRLNHQADADGWTLGLTAPGGQVLSVLELTGADKHLPFLEETGSL